MHKDYLEHLAAKFVAQATKEVPERIVTCILASSLCSRSTDLCMLWHPNYREKNKIRLLRQEIIRR